ncbi:Cell division ATP-binding protein FtsE [Nocardioides dokdonensis FR1436]|uniref:Cell division ATP-binding protein FtsE n=1 Tax=Nocardioides dokdonensis FR1436 TaxID=1300347 RepID=A0A1A9GNL8_9ACTN|nr:Cell division ATP-binding protein FtsE [Nocardioides dokdonensis FR1436]
MLRLRATSRRYDDALALSPVSLTLHPGTVSLVTGHNGSGKSTLLRLAAGLLRPSSGTREASGRALYLLSGQGARAVESPRSAVETAARLSGASRGDAEEAAAAALDAVGLGAVAARAVGTFSSGQRARVSLAVALACPVPVVCLDEPTAHLDSDGSDLVAATIAVLASRGSAVLVASHDPVALRWRVDARLHLDGGVVAAPVLPDGRTEALPA